MSLRQDGPCGEIKAGIQDWLAHSDHLSSNAKHMPIAIGNNPRLAMKSAGAMRREDLGRSEETGERLTIIAVALRRAIEMTDRAF